jgi:dihydrolipoamide dehydrogenase
VEDAGSGCKVTIKTQQGLQTIECDIVLSATGVVANIEGIGLEETGIKRKKEKLR